MSWFDTLAISLKNAQHAANPAAGKGNGAAGKVAAKQHKANAVVDLNSNTGARDPKQVEDEQSRQKGTREQEAELQKLHKQFMEQVAIGVENRMHRLGLRNEDPRNQMINRVYCKYLGLKGGAKMLSVAEYKELNEISEKLSKLADEVEKRQAPTEEERAALAKFLMSYDFKTGAPMMASIDGAGGELSDEQRKERDEFYLSRASIVERLDNPDASSDVLAIGQQVFAQNDWRPYSQSGWTGDPNWKGGIDCSDFVSEYLRKIGINGDWDSDGLYARTGELKDKTEGFYFDGSESDIQRAKSMLRPGDYIAYGDSGGKDGHTGYLLADGMIAQSGKGGVGKRSVDDFFRSIARRDAKFVIGRPIVASAPADPPVNTNSSAATEPSTPNVVKKATQAGMQAATTEAVVIDSNMTLEQALKGNRAPDSVTRDLTLVNVQYIGFDKKKHQGQILIHRGLKQDIEGIFSDILASGCPVEKVIPIVEFDWDDAKSIKNNNSSGFNYREVIDPTKSSHGISHHGGGEDGEWGAFDINPYQNPFVKANGQAKRPYDESGQVKGTVTSDSPIYKAFIKHGWTWGGDWNGGRDYQHFEKRVPRLP